MIMTRFKLFVLQRWILVFRDNSIFLFASFAQSCDSTTFYPGQSAMATGSPVQSISGLAGTEYFRPGRYRIFRPAGTEY